MTAPDGCSPGLPPLPSTSPNRDRLLVAAVSAGTSLLSAAWMTTQGRIPFTSDQAVPALMAIDIKDSGNHPAFHWGVHYAGTLEPHLLSLLFRVLPASVLTYRFFLATLLVATIVLVGETCRRTWGRKAGIAGAAYLGLGPSFFYFKGLTSDGAYAAILVTLAASLVAATLVAGNGRRWLAPVAALGFFTGLAWWVHPVAAAFAPVAGLAVIWQKRSATRFTVCAALVVAFIFGSSPWWIENFRLDFPSLSMPELAGASAIGVLERIGDLLSHGWPMLVGARSARSESPTFPGAIVPALILIVGLSLAAIRHLRRSEPGPSRFLLVASLLLVLTPPALAVSVARTDLRTDVRFLIPSYLGLAPLVAFAVTRLGASGRGPFAPALGFVLAALGPGSQFRAPRFEAPHDGLLRESREAVDALRRLGVREVYGSYWHTYRLAFLGRGDVVPGSFGTGTAGMVRNPAFQQVVDASIRPGFLLSSLDAARLAAFVKSRGWESRRTALTGLGLTVVSDLPEEALEIVRRCGCIPTAVGPGYVEWLRMEGPSTVRKGERLPYRVAFRVNGPVSPGPEVRLAPRWRAVDGSDFGLEGSRTPLPSARWPKRDFRATLWIPVTVVPGKYRLTIDMVEEHVTWFEWRGIAPPFLEVEVTP
ncbi:MAG: hypothetical protein KJ062_05970 [Thermoanaerobaculia bacterium]|nr:hypothetical protein [Thermoanaerobaculia bacterium]